MNPCPKCILRRDKFGSGDNGTGFNERFHSNLNVTSSSVPLIIQKLQVSDSAVYYCALRPTVTAAHSALTQKPLALRKHPHFSKKTGTADQMIHTRQKYILCLKKKNKNTFIWSLQIYIMHLRFNVFLFFLLAVASSSSALVVLSV